MNVVSIFNIKIDDLGLSVRTFKGLYKYAGIRTIEDLLNYCAGDEDKILSVRQCGSVSKLEVISILNNISLDAKVKIYLGMTKKEIEKLKRENKEIPDYEFKRQHTEYLEKIKTRFLTAQLSKLGVDPSKFFQPGDTRSKTIGYLLKCISNGSVKKDSIDEIMDLMANLGLSNIYLGMPMEEVENIYISYENSNMLKSMIKQARTTIKDDILEKNRLEHQVEIKREAYLKLEELVKEKERLAALDKELDEKIEMLLNRINYGKHK